jgi:hypothetical protein
LQTPPWYAGSPITAAALNELVPTWAVLGTDTPITTTVATPVLTLAGLTPGQWEIHGVITCEASASAGTIDLSLHAAGSLAVSSMRVDVVQRAAFSSGAAAAESSYTTSMVALGDIANGFTMTSGDLYVFVIDGIINVSTAGSLTVDVAEGTGGDNFEVRANSYVRAELVLA